MKDMAACLLTSYVFLVYIIFLQMTFLLVSAKGCIVATENSDDKSDNTIVTHTLTSNSYSLSSLRITVSVKINWLGLGYHVKLLANDSSTFFSDILGVSVSVTGI